MTLSLTFGAWLKHRRHAYAMTQQALAQQIGYAVVTVRKLENGERRPSRPMLHALATALDISTKEWAELLALAQLAAPLPAEPLTIRPRYRLPTLLTSLVGRQQQIRDIQHHITTAATRWVTLVGPPGVGKTHLAIAVSHSLAPRFTAGVIWLPLASLTSPHDVLPRLAEAISLTITTARTIAEQLIEALQPHTLLIVLDNCEHVAAIATTIVDIVTYTPHITVLATSRTPLDIAGEQVYLVPPLATHPTALNGLSEAADMFVQRLRVPFSAVPTSIATCNRIAEQVDGLPLAIELVAALSNRLSLTQLTHQVALPLAHQLPHQATRSAFTVGDILDRSVPLLPPATQAIWWWCGIFRGGFSAEALAAVAVTPLADNITADVTILTEQSIISPMTNAAPLDNPLYSMLELLRQYALQQLERLGWHHLAAERHAAYYCDFAERCQAGLVGPDPMTWLAVLEDARANLDSALGWAMVQPHHTLALRFINALWDLWERSGRWIEARRWIDQLLLRRLAPVERADTLSLLLHCAVRQGEYHNAEEAGQAVLLIATEMGDVSLQAKMFNNLGVVVSRWGRLDEAQAYYNEALTRYRDLLNNERIFSVQENIAVMLLDQGYVIAAQAAFLALQAELHQYHFTEAAARMPYYLGHCASLQGEQQRAVQLFHECLAQMQSLQMPYWVALNYFGLARTALFGDDIPAAQTFGEQALQMFIEIGDPLWVAQCQCIASECALQQQDWATATTWATTALQTYEELQAHSGVVTAAVIMGKIALGQQNADEAAQWFEDVVSSAPVLHTHIDEIDGLEGLAWVAYLRQDWEALHHYDGKAALLRQRLGVVRSTYDEQRYVFIHKALLDQAVIHQALFKNERTGT